MRPRAGNEMYRSFDVAAIEREARRRRSGSELPLEETVRAREPHRIFERAPCDVDFAEELGMVRQTLARARREMEALLVYRAIVRLTKEVEDRRRLRTPREHDSCAEIIRRVGRRFQRLKVRSGTCRVAGGNELRRDGGCEHGVVPPERIDDCLKGIARKPRRGVGKAAARNQRLGLLGAGDLHSTMLATNL